jgi:radical SAM superfamily enzyme YgiQ (UPF0313 family)
LEPRKDPVPSSRPGRIRTVAFAGMEGYLHDYTTTHFRMARIGPVILASILREHGIETKVYAEAVHRFDRRTLREICRADMVAISVLTYGANRAYALCSLIRQVNPAALILMGDVHPTLMPEHALAHCDFVIRGEGDEAIVELLAALNQEPGAKALSEIGGLSYWDVGEIHHNPARPRPRDINVVADLSLIDTFVRPNWRTAFTEGRETMSVIQASRGCPIACTFCLGSSILGTQYRTKEIDRVIANLDRIQGFGLGSHPVVFFIDNHFFIDRPWTKELLRRICERDYGFHFIAFGQYFVGRDPEMLDLLRQAGFIRIFVGFESINPETLQAFHKKQSEASMRECISAMHEHGIEIHGSFILGGETDDAETAEATIRFALETEIMTASFFALTEYPCEPHPFVPATNVLPQHRLLPGNLDYFNLNFVSFYPRRLRPSHLQRLLISAYDRFYSLSRAGRSLLDGNSHRARQRAIGHWAQRKMVRQMRDYVPQLEAAEEGLYTPAGDLVEERLEHRPRRLTNSDPHRYNPIYGIPPLRENVRERFASLAGES